MDLKLKFKDSYNWHPSALLSEILLKWDSNSEPALSLQFAATKSNKAGATTRAKDFKPGQAKQLFFSLASIINFLGCRDNKDKS